MWNKSSTDISNNIITLQSKMTDNTDIVIIGSFMLSIWSGYTMHAMFKGKFTKYSEIV